MSVRMSQMGASPPRLELPQPIAATLLDDEVSIVEVSLVGCSVHHPSRVKVGANVSLHFMWEGKKARVDGKVARSTMQFVGGKPVYVSGVQFCESVDQTPPVVRSIVASLIAPAVEEEEKVEAKVEVKVEAEPPKPKPRPSSPPPMHTYSESVPFLRFQDDFDDVETEPEVEPLFLRCRFVNGRWENERVAEAAQPDDEGFTIFAETDDIDGLCRTYEVADPETRRMMRISFEIANEQQRRA